MGQTTKLADLLNPQVLADYVDSKLIDNIVFAPLATIDDTLVGNPGDTLTVPVWNYIGDADDLTEASDISTVKLTASHASVTVKEAGKGVEISYTAILSAYGDPVGEIGSQLVKSIASKQDVDFLGVMTSNAASTMTFTAQASTSTAAIGVQDISDALELFGEDIEGQKAVVVSPKLYTKIRNVKDWAPASEFAAGALVRGAVGQIFGCDVMVSNRLKGVAGTGLDENAFIVKPGALRLILKRNALAEKDRDILRRVWVYTITKHYVPYLYNQSGLIKIKPKTGA